MPKKKTNKRAGEGSVLPVPAQPGVPTDPTVFQDVSDDAIDYLFCSVAENTVRARKADLKVFVDWGGSLPSNPEEVANFIADQARTSIDAGSGSRELNGSSALRSAA